MSKQQQPKEYLTMSFEEYGEFKMLLEDEDDHSNYLLEQLEKYRSRPHPTPAAGAQETRGCVIIDDEQRDFLLWLGRHDAAIARQAREDVLDKLFSWVHNHNSFTPVLMKDMLETIPLMEHLESLRHHSEQQEQPR